VHLEKIFFLVNRETCPLKGIRQEVQLSDDSYKVGLFSTDQEKNTKKRREWKRVE